MESRRNAYLQALGVERWQRRGPDRAGARAPESLVGDCSPAPQPPARETRAPAPAASPEGAPPVSEIDWDALEPRVLACTRCPLHETRTQAVFGTGDRQAAWMVIGEAPGEDEDRQGEPFVGRAGRLLNAMLAALGLAREQVYIANILKCRPPQNRDPRPEEAARCEPYLHRQVALVGPRVILAVGRVAAQNLLHSDAPVGRLRGVVHRLPGGDTPVVVTYHPAYLLRSPGEKGRAWQDLKLAWRVAAERGWTPP